MDDRLIQRAAKDILNSKKAIAFTGAGISVESGIPDFRGAQGLWQKYDPEDYAHIHAFTSDPDRVWLMLKEMFALVMGAKPNPAHVGLAELERMGYLSSVITQNVDGLHQAAGSRNVIEFHGTHRTFSCLRCSSTIDGTTLKLEDLPPRCSRCSSLLKPDVVFFGEPIPWKAQVASFQESKSCDLILSIGTSAVVYPAASIPMTAKEKGAIVVEINREPTPLTDEISDYLICGSAGEIIPAIVETVKRSTPPTNPSPAKLCRNNKKPTLGKGERRSGMSGGLPGSGLLNDKQGASQRFRAATFKRSDSGIPSV
jgi:NAD-dependent deacetylase